MHHDKPLKNLNRKNSLCSKSCSIDESQKVNLEGVHHDSSKSKSQSVQNTTHPNNPIYKVTMAKTNLSHEHLAKRSTQAPRVKPDAIHLYLNKSM